MKKVGFYLVSIVSLTVLVQSCHIDREPIRIEGPGGSSGFPKAEVGESSDFVQGERQDSVVQIAGSPENGISASGAGGSTRTNPQQGGAGGVAEKKDAGRDYAGRDSRSDAEAKVDTGLDTVIPERPKTTGPIAYGDWDYYEVEGAICRDGSPAGYYLRKGTSKNLMIFLNGGGACYDSFFCNTNPANVDQSLDGETLMDATWETFTRATIPSRQQPPDEGILQKVPGNPVMSWNMVFVPYCTGDVYAGTTPDARVVTALLMPEQQFLGYSNLGLFYRSFGPDFMDSEKILLAGSSAGGFGVVLNFIRTQAFFNKSILYFITDSAIPFRDQYQPACLQQRWRELWGINQILPSDCASCFNADGGGLYELTTYLIAKNAERVLGGAISSVQDEVMKLFYSAGLNNCTGSALTNMLSYPITRYPLALQDYLDNVINKNNVASYIVSGSTHQHLFRTRFYQDNGVGMTIAEWVGEILANRAPQIGRVY
ncbi:MAG: hypothetical protein JXA30_19170 [Deltaproteobacteria bacterium]|nr:hypothetical protein [Deltaproteobacteria bacterium]